MRIDTHRHFGGSIPTVFVWETIRDGDLHWLAESHDDVVAQMTFANDEPRSFHRFLDKFRILDEISWTPELIAGSIKSACDEFEKERLDYVWLDFSINKYMRIGWHKKEAIQFIHDCFEQYRPGRVGLVLSLKYESMQASQRQYASLIDDPEVVDLLFGLDLVGDENHYNKKFYKPILKEWAAAKKMTRAHVGEYGSAKNVKGAIKSGVTNIAHGIKITNDPDVVKLAKDKGVCFDIAPTSNELTGVVTDSEFHPMTNMLFSGLRLTVGSDDPVQCNTTLDQEFEAARRYGVTEEQIEKMVQEAIRATEQFIELPAL
jgi:adenosine deaminase